MLRAAIGQDFLYRLSTVLTDMSAYIFSTPEPKAPGELIG